MMSDEVAEIFILFIFGGIFTWRALTLNEITYRGKRYRRKDSPFDFWVYTTLVTTCAVLSILGGIVFSIYLLYTSWR
jgi:hypothetical protein